MSLKRLCRLCVNGCSKGYKSLYDENGSSNTAYDITAKYFDPMLFNLKDENTPAVVCLRCWHHIFDFHNFRQSVHLAQRKHLTLDVTPTDKSSDLAASSNVVYYDIFEMDESRIDPPLPDVEMASSAVECPIMDSIELATGEHFLDDIVVKEEVEYITPPELNVVECPVDDYTPSDATYHSDDDPDRKRVCFRQKRFDCKVCGKLFERKFNFLRHMITKHHYSKHDINREFKNNKLSKRKRVRVHTKPKVQDCKVCGKYFSRNFSLNRHMASQHNISNGNVSTTVVQDNYESPHEFPKDCITNKDDGNVLSNDALVSYELISHHTISDANSQISHDDGHVSLNENPEDSFTDGYFNDDCERKDICKIEMKPTDGPVYSDQNEVSLPESLLKVSETRIDSKVNVSQKTKSPKRQSKRRRKWTTKELDDYIAKWKQNLECRLCKRSCSSFSLLQTHFNLKHPRDELYISCCKSKFKTRSPLVEHIHFHANPNVFQCELCEKTFTKGQTLQSHILKIHNIVADKTYIPPENLNNLNIQTTNRDNARRNDNSASLEIQRPAPRDDRNRPYIDRKNAIGCKVCGKHLSKQKLKRHMLKHNINPLDDIPVSSNDIHDNNSIESYISQNNSQWNSNFRIKPTSVIGCKACGKCFSRKYNLYRHMMSKHNISRNIISHEHYVKLSTNDVHSTDKNFSHFK